MRRTLLSLLILISSSICWAQVSDRIVAIVNDDVVTESELERLLSLVYVELASIYKPPQLTAELEKAKAEILDRLIQDQLILQAAKSQGIEVSQGEVDAKLEEIIGNFNSEEEFFQVISQQGLDLESLRQRIKDVIMMEAVIEKEVKSRIVIQPGDITSYYESHIGQYRLPEEMEVSYILIRLKDGSGQEDLRRQAEQLWQRLKDGADLEELARQDPKVEYRNLGKVRKGELVEEVEGVVSDLRPGEFSEIVRTKLGFQIFKLKNRYPARTQELREVQGKIHGELFRQRFSRRLNSWIEELKKDAYIVIK